VTSSITTARIAPDLLGSMRVIVSLSHTFDSDLVLTLIAPNGARITLARNRGGSGDNYVATFDDGAATPIGAGVAPFNGSFQPEEPLAALSGISTAGTWTLEIADVAAGDFGTLFGWSIDFSYYMTDRANDQAQILGNFIGTNALGMAGLGNGGDGIFGEHSCVAQIGLPGGVNVISGNVGPGLSISSTFCAANAIQSNLIGVKPDGVTPLPNGGDGIAASGPIGIIGGPSPAYGNVIAYNAGAGVNVAGSASLRQTTIRGNSIHDNGGLGIDLAPLGVTPNDPGDNDFGANLLQNFPAITSVVPQVMNSVLISGTLQSAPNGKFTIDVYGNAQPDTSGYGEGRTWLGSGTFTTDAGGNATWSVLTQNGALGLITATATDFAGNTSEFSGLAKTPQEASPAKNMQVAPGAGGTLNITYAPACGATNHALYWGTMGPGMIGAGGLVWTNALCGLGTSGTANVLLGLGNPPVGKGFFFTIAGQNGSVEGSYGQDSGSVEEPEANLPVVCNLPQFLGGGCF
jgi:subtilisin-like proprotein convertase family protein